MIEERIRLLRKSLGLTQQEFADRIGLKRNSVASYEIGKNIPMDAVLFSMCREFNVNEHWLRTGDGTMFIEMDRDDELAAWTGKMLSHGQDIEFMKKFVQMLSKLTADEWKVLGKMALLMTEENEKA